MGILQSIERSMVTAMFGVNFNDRKRSMDWMFMLGLNEYIDQLANSACWYGHVLRREDGHVMRRALDLKVEGRMEAEGDMEKAG